MSGRLTADGKKEPGGWTFVIAEKLVNRCL